MAKVDDIVWFEFVESKVFPNKLLNCRQRFCLRFSPTLCKIQSVATL